MTLRFSRNFWKEHAEATDGSHPLELNVPENRYADVGNGFQSLDYGARPDEQHVSSAEMREDCTVSLPENYDPNYPYPLLVWLHGAGGSEQDLLDVMPKISAQNYIGLGLRGTLLRGVSPVGYGWPSWEKSITDFEESVYSIVVRMRREFHIHSERIIPVGFDEGGVTAMRLLLNRPEWFGGAIAFGAHVPGKKQTLARFRDLGGKRILIGTGADDQAVTPSNMIHLGRLFHSAGMDVTTRVYDAGHEITPEMLDHVNRWVMDRICSVSAG